MKKFMSIFLLLAICLTLCVPAFASQEETSSDGFLVPTLSSGEIWFPANGVMPLASQECPEGHTPPSGYVYQGYVKGNSVLEASLRGGTWTLLGLLPGLGTISLILTAAEISSTVSSYLENNGEIPATYYQYVYYNSAENGYWYHYVYKENVSGTNDYLDCYIRWADAAADRVVEPSH